MRRKATKPAEQSQTASERLAALERKASRRQLAIVGRQLSGYAAELLEERVTLLNHIAALSEENERLERMLAATHRVNAAVERSLAQARDYALGLERALLVTEPGADAPLLH